MGVFKGKVGNQQKKVKKNEKKRPLSIVSVLKKNLLKNKIRRKCKT
jgi:hypothetical protein